MGKPQRRFGQEFEAEAVRLVEVGGRTQRKIAMDLSVGLSTLRRWIDKRREHETQAPPDHYTDELRPHRSKACDRSLLREVDAKVVLKGERTWPMRGLFW